MPHDKKGPEFAYLRSWYPTSTGGRAWSPTTIEGALSGDSCMITNILKERPRSAG